MELQFNQNWQKLDLKNTFSPPQTEVGFLGLKWWVSEAKKWPEKGGLEGGTSPYYLSKMSAPPLSHSKMLLIFDQFATQVWRCEALLWDFYAIS